VKLWGVDGLNLHLLEHRSESDLDVAFDKNVILAQIVAFFYQTFDFSHIQVLIKKKNPLS